VHCTKISSKFECQGQRSRSSGTKKRKSAAFCLRFVLWGVVLVRHFFPEPFSGALLRRWENQRMLSSSCKDFMSRGGRCSRLQRLVSTLAYSEAVLSGRRPGGDRTFIVGSRWRPDRRLLISDYGSRPRRAWNRKHATRRRPASH